MPPRDKRIYFFEHQMMPRWTHATKGAFYRDLEKGAYEKLHEGGLKVVDEAFSKAIKVEAHPEIGGVVIEFEAPVNPVHCYFVAIVQVGDAYRYLTLEKDEDIMGTGVKDSLCEWTSAGHTNFGPRTYTDKQSFIKDVASLLKQPVSAAATTTPSSAH